ncbi:ABC transporter ATP-binding protein [Microbacterium sp. 18062]|uniref:ABC transporter ATP-binding protein n=1 Tax=Microbacterium sp. 18062 TaxID=2681410 RepID=UPI0013579490|nr:ABC transporter ATP-binding protein [Microbacterium sp. 18062]
MTDTLLSARDVTVRFGGVTAVSTVSFDVHRGEFFAIIGPNGAGKTTLFNCLSGLVRYSGDITFDGVSLVGRRADQIAQVGISRTFQNLGLFSTMTVLENVLVGGASKVRSGIPSGLIWWGRARREDIAARVRAYEVLDLLGLADIAHEPIASLPYGTRKRVELAKAAAAAPKLLLLDEPVAGMNHSETEELIGHVLTLQDQLALTIVLIEHDTFLVMDVAERILALNFGQPIGLGTPTEIQANPKVVEAYLGASAPVEAMPTDADIPVPSPVRTGGED